MPPFDTGVPALILKIGRYPLHHGTAGIIRTLGRVGVPVYAIVEDRFTPVAFSRYLAGAFVVPTAALEPAALLERLAGIARKFARQAILIPTDDLASAFIAENAPVLRKWFLAPRIDGDLPRRLANKRRLDAILRQHSIPCPEASFPATVGDVHEFIARAFFPVVVKAAESQRTPAGLHSTSLARTPGELLSIYEKAGRGADLILQEYIPESCAEDWIYHGYANPGTGCMISFTGRKLRSYPPFAGPTTLGVSLRNEALERQSERLLQAIGYAGIMDLDYRFDRRDGRYKLLDFNPRAGANFRMFENRAGIDVVRAMHLDLTGREVPRAPAVERRVFIVESYDVCASLGYFRRGALTPGEWWRSLQGRREFAWLSLDDPVPFPVMCTRLLFRALTRLIRRPKPESASAGAKASEKAVMAAAGGKKDSGD